MMWRGVHDGCPVVVIRWNAKASERGVGEKRSLLAIVVVLIHNRFLRGSVSSEVDVRTCASETQF